jgi:hypothetical protein
MRGSHYHMGHKTGSICGNEGCDVPSLFLGDMLSAFGCI